MGNLYKKGSGYAGIMVTRPETLKDSLHAAACRCVSCSWRSAARSGLWLLFALTLATQMRLTDLVAIGGAPAVAGRSQERLGVRRKRPVPA